MYRKWSTLVLLTLVMPFVAFAQNTGKLTGRVTEAATGDGIPGAIVTVVGTTLGAATDIDGNYTILGVPVGSWNIRAEATDFSPLLVQGVEINSGYTRTLNFEMQVGAEVDEVQVVYERPLIQNDAIGTPRVASSEQIQNLPVRGIANVASIQAGVVSTEGSSTLNIRGGRGEEVVYFVDGVKVIGSNVIPQAAIQEQEMLIGNISARYGDAMSGVINITTKTGSSEFFGSAEGITSSGLDSYGYNLASASLGGPIIGSRVGFFMAGEVELQDDANPRALGQLVIRDDARARLAAAPMGFVATSSTGGRTFIPLPASVASGTGVPVNGNTVVVRNGVITLSDGSTIAVPAGVDTTSVRLTLEQLANYLTADDFETRASIPGNGARNYSFTGNVTAQVLQSARLRLGGRYRQGQFEDYVSRLDVFLNPDGFRQNDRQDIQGFATWTQYLSDKTFFQVQGDYSRYTGENYDQRFGKNLDDLLRYGDISESAYAELLGYKSIGTTQTINGQTYAQLVNTYDDAPSIQTEVIGSLVTPIGGRVRGYSKFHNEQLRFSGNASTQLGINQLEFGAEFERRTNRSWSIDPRQLANYVYDNCTSGVCIPNAYAIDSTSAGKDTVRVERYSDLPANVLDIFVSNVGYNIFGTEFVDDEDLDAYADSYRFKDASAYNVAPYKPIYYGGYVQNKIEFKDIVLNLGLRLDVFDNNVKVLSDPYARLPIQRVSDLSGSGTNGLAGYTAPQGTESDWAVYFRQGSNTVIGYRDLDGNFYVPTADGSGVNPAQAADVVLNGAPRNLKDDQGNNILRPISAMYEDYKAQVAFMPRVGVSFPISDRALFFARYGVVSQRPTTNSFASIATLASSGGSILNNSLKPQKTTEYEIGFRQRLGERQAVTMSGFMRQIDNLISRRDILNAFPSVYESYQNVDFGTVKGFELGYDMRRTRNLEINANYTLSFAQGTGSGADATATITWVDETPPNFISPLSYDQRHRFNVSADYRYGRGEGPMVFGTRLLENFGVNLLMQGGSGLPYTAITSPFAINASRATNPTGGINSDRMPGYVRLDLRVDRRFYVGTRSSLTAFLWVQNLLDSDRVQNVYRATGLGNDDGYLATAEGQTAISSGVPIYETLYQGRVASPFNYGIPRLTRLGLRFNF